MVIPVANASHKPANQRARQPYLFPWVYISLGVGRTRCFLKMTNQLPQILHTFGGSTSPPISSFPRLNEKPLWSSTLPCHHFDFYYPCACLPKVPPPTSGTLGVGGRALCVLSVRTTPCCHLSRGGDVPWASTHRPPVTVLYR